ncbi:MAG TPA: hypothetical protein VJ860_15570 [Polyangia bacterium]|jgi:hypothetical protein|nr:hypothetical protein [Polyangia bacterium]
MPIPRRIVLILATAAATACSNSPQPLETPPTASPDAGVDSSGVGLPCNLGLDAGPTLAIFNTQGRQCPSRLCLKPVDQSGSGNTAAFCSDICSTESDCVGETRNTSNPSDKRCAGGFACTVVFTVGPLCCAKLCVCKDFLVGPVQTPSVCNPDGGMICQF